MNLSVGMLWKDLRFPNVSISFALYGPCSTPTDSQLLASTAYVKYMDGEFPKFGDFVMVSLPLINPVIVAPSTYFIAIISDDWAYSAELSAPGKSIHADMNHIFRFNFADGFPRMSSFQSTITEADGVTSIIGNTCDASVPIPPLPVCPPRQFLTYPSSFSPATDLPCPSSSVVVTDTYNGESFSVDCSVDCGVRGFYTMPEHLTPTLVNVTQTIYALSFIAHPGTDAGKNYTMRASVYAQGANSSTFVLLAQANQTTIPGAQLAGNYTYLYLPITPPVLVLAGSTIWINMFADQYGLLILYDEYSTTLTTSAPFDPSQPAPSAVSIVARAASQDITRGLLGCAALSSFILNPPAPTCGIPGRDLTPISQIQHTVAVGLTGQFVCNVCGQVNVNYVKELSQCNAHDNFQVDACLVTHDSDYTMSLTPLSQHRRTSTASSTNSSVAWSESSRYLQWASDAFDDPAQLTLTWLFECSAVELNVCYPRITYSSSPFGTALQANVTLSTVAACRCGFERNGFVFDLWPFVAQYGNLSFHRASDGMTFHYHPCFMLDFDRSTYVVGEGARPQLSVVSRSGVASVLLNLTYDVSWTLSDEMQLVLADPSSWQPRSNGSYDVATSTYHVTSSVVAKDMNVTVFQTSYRCDPSLGVSGASFHLQQLSNWTLAQPESLLHTGLVNQSHTYYLMTVSSNDFCGLPLRSVLPSSLSPWTGDHGLLEVSIAKNVHKHYLMTVSAADSCELPSQPISSFSSSSSTAGFSEQPLSKLQTEELIIFMFLILLLIAGCFFCAYRQLAKWKVYDQTEYVLYDPSTTELAETTNAGEHSKLPKICSAIDAQFSPPESGKKIELASSFR